MYEFSVEAQISAEAEEVWAVVTDVAGWPAWDPHEKAARLDGPFEPGTIGWSKPHGGPATEWTIVADNVAASGNTVTVIDDAAVSIPQRFYRITVMP